jgi:hypothetical protein
MDMGYVILLLLGLVYCATAIFLYLRARQDKPRSEVTPEAPPAEPEAP